MLTYRQVKQEDRGEENPQGWDPRHTRKRKPPCKSEGQVRYGITQRRPGEAGEPY